MPTGEIIGTTFLGLFSLVAIIAWAMNIWGGWAEKTYERTKDSTTAWYWLRRFRIPTTRDNCIRFMKITSAGGIGVLVMFWVVGLTRLFAYSR